MRILTVDHIDFPLPVPALKLFFAQDRLLHLAEHFKRTSMWTASDPASILAYSER